MTAAADASQIYAPQRTHLRVMTDGLFFASSHSQ